jgi:epoxyqueuosine reductase
MIVDLKKIALNNGNRLEIVPIERMKLLESDINSVVFDDDMMDYVNFIKSYFYKFDEIPQDMKSVIILAVSKTSYAKVSFMKNGKEYKAFSPTAAGLEEAMNKIVSFVKDAGYEIVPVFHLPLKRLAVQSGLAEYGRNNIAYVQGFGCNVVFAAFYTNIVCESDNWRSAVVAKKCDSCDYCMKNCPTDAILADSFIINAKRCISFFHVSGEEYPDWMPDTAHHSLYYCLKCQVGCPMNEGLVSVIDVAFDEKETELILAGKSFDEDISETFEKKVKLLGFGQWHSVSRNLKVLLEVMDKGHRPSV